LGEKYGKISVKIINGKAHKIAVAVAAAASNNGHDVMTGLYIPASAAATRSSTRTTLEIVNILFSFFAQIKRTKS